MENNPSLKTKYATPFARTFMHGTKAQLQIGDLITIGHLNNYDRKSASKYVFMTGTLDAAIWGAELSHGEAKERIYLVEPTGEYEEDPDLTNTKFSGNPTMSYRSAQPLRVIAEICNWQGHAPEQVESMKQAIQNFLDKGVTSHNEM